MSDAAGQHELAAVSESAATDGDDKLHRFNLRSERDLPTTDALAGAPDADGSEARREGEGGGVGASPLKDSHLSGTRPSTIQRAPRTGSRPDNGRCASPPRRHGTSADVLPSPTDHRREAWDAGGDSAIFAAVIGGGAVSEQLEFVGLGNRRVAVFGAELGVDVAQVSLECIDGDVEGGCEFLVRHSCRKGSRVLPVRVRSRARSVDSRRHLASRSPPMLRRSTWRTPASCVGLGPAVVASSWVARRTAVGLCRFRR